MNNKSTDQVKKITVMRSRFASDGDSAFLVILGEKYGLSEMSLAGLGVSVEKILEQLRGDRKLEKLPGKMRSMVTRFDALERGRAT